MKFLFPLFILSLHLCTWSAFGVPTKESADALELTSPHSIEQPSQEQQGAILPDTASEFLEAELAKFISKIELVVPEANPLSSLNQLRGILTGDVDPIRLNYTVAKVSSLALGQFDDSLSIRELIANAIDSYYYDTKLKLLAQNEKTVDVIFYPNSLLEIQDRGVGMGLSELVYFLLTPDRSRNEQILNASAAAEGVTGRFGQGFFSVLSFLKEAQDFIEIETKTQSGQGYSLKLFIKDGNYYLRLAPSSKSDRGTTLRIFSSKLNDQEQIQILNNVVQQYFRFTNRALIRLNSQIVNMDPSYFHHLHIKVRTNDDKYIEMKVMHSDAVAKTSGELALTVNGILITSYPIESKGYELTVVDFPSNTPLTPDRGSLHFYHPGSIAFVKALTEFAVKKNNFTLLNSILPLLKQDAFNLLKEIDFSFTQYALPNHPDLNGTIGIGKTPQTLTPSSLVTSSSSSSLSPPSAPLSSASVSASTSITDVPFLSLEIFDRSNIPRLLPSLINDTLNKIIPFNSNGTGEILRFIHTNKGTLSFLDHRLINSQYPLTYFLINKIYSDRNRNLQNSRSYSLIPDHILEPVQQEESPSSKRLRMDTKNPNSALITENKTTIIQHLVELSTQEPYLSKFPNAQAGILFQFLLLFYKTPDISKNSITTWLSSEFDFILTLINMLSEPMQLNWSTQYADYNPKPPTSNDLKTIEDTLRFQLTCPYASLLKTTILLRKRFLFTQEVGDIFDKIYPKRLTEELEVRKLRHVQESDLVQLSSLIESQKSTILQIREYYEDQIPTSTDSTEPYFNRTSSVINATINKRDDLSTPESSLSVLLNVARKISLVSKASISFSHHLVTQSNAPEADTAHLVTKTSTLLTTQIVKAQKHEEILEDINKTLAICNNSGLVQDCARLFIVNIGSIVLTLPSLLQLSNSKEVLFNYFIYLKKLASIASLDKSLFQSQDSTVWSPFLLNHLLQNISSDILERTLLFFRTFYLSIYRHSISLVDSPTLKQQLGNNCYSTMRDMLSILKEQGLMSEESKKLSAFYGEVKNFIALQNTRNTPRQTLNNLNELYRYYSDNGLITPNSITYMFQFIYGTSVPFYRQDETYKGDAFTSERPLEWKELEKFNLTQHETIDPNLNRIRIKKSINQHPDLFHWMRTSFSNSKLKNATSYEVEVSKDTTGRLLVSIKDNGDGYNIDELRRLFIPGLSSNEHMTIFRLFSNVVIQTSTGDQTLSSLLFRQENENIRIAETSQHLKDSERFKGTQIFLKTNRIANQGDPTKIKSELLKTIFDNTLLSVTFNKSTLQVPEQHIDHLSPLAEANLTVRGKEKGRIKILQHGVKGLYYNGTFYSDSTERFRTQNPQILRELEAKLTLPVIVNLDADLTTNTNRTGFKEEELFRDQIALTLQDGTFRAIAKETLFQPNFLLTNKMLPYDFYDSMIYENRTDQFVKTTREKVRSGINNGISPATTLGNDPLQFGAYILSLPLVSKPDTWGDSLWDLKQAIRKWLLEAQMIESDGKYKRGTNFDVESFKTFFNSPNLSLLIEHFIKEIRSSIPESFESNRSHAKVYKDFTVNRIPKHLQTQRPSIIALREFIGGEIQHFLGKSVDVRFFFDPGTRVLAHAKPGTKYISINLAGQRYTDFLEMLKSKKLNKKIYVSLISTATHEMTHLEEGSEETESTHDVRFFDRQQQLLEPFFKFEMKDIERVETLLRNFSSS